MSVKSSIKLKSSTFIFLSFNGTEKKGRYLMLFVYLKVYFWRRTRLIGKISCTQMNSSLKNKISPGQIKEYLLFGLTKIFQTGSM